MRWWPQILLTAPVITFASFVMTDCNDSAERASLTIWYNLNCEWWLTEDGVSSDVVLMSSFSFL